MGTQFGSKIGNQISGPCAVFNCGAQNRFQFWNQIVFQVLGPARREKFKKKMVFGLFFGPQVKLFFVWIGYLNSIGYGLNDAVWINIDESPIPYHVSGKKGLRLHPLSKKDDHEMRDRTSLAQIRSRCTLIASIASDNTLQQHLPQVLMPNERGLKKNGNWPVSQPQSIPAFKF